MRKSFSRITLVERESNENLSPPTRPTKLDAQSESARFVNKISLHSRNLKNEKGMPLGNLTSQFFANIYLNELDNFVKRRLRVEYYIRYVDDFVLLHNSEEKLEIWKGEIDKFLREKLKLELHPDKSKIISLSNGIDFVGFRNYYHFKLLRKRNIRKIISNIKRFEQNKISKEQIIEIFQGWNAYAKWSDSLELRKKVLSRINLVKFNG